MPKLKGLHWFDKSQIYVVYYNARHALCKYIIGNLMALKSFLLKATDLEASEYIGSN